jgi:hypothetical protein
VSSQHRQRLEPENRIIRPSSLRHQSQGRPRTNIFKRAASQHLQKGTAMTNLLTTIKPKADVQKLIGILAKNLKTADAYIQRRQDMTNAFQALESKKAKVASEGKDALRNAGTLEAKRLLGQVTEEEARSLDVNLTAIHEQKDRLEAAKDALLQQQIELEQELPQHLGTIKAVAGQLSQALLDELHNEMIEAVAKVNSVINRLHVIRSTIGAHSFAGATINDTEIPSFVDGNNLVRPPIRIHPIHGHILDAAWERDDLAVALHESLQPFHQTKRQLERLEMAKKTEAA